MLIVALVLVVGYVTYLFWYHGRFAEKYPPKYGGRATVVARGETAEFGGGRWRLVSVAEGQGSSFRPPPPAARIVSAVVAVTPVDAAAAKRLATCAFTGRDGAGRAFAPDIGHADANRFPGTRGGCLAEDGSPVRPGRTVHVLVSFLVPKESAGSVRPEVRLSDPAGVYLRFER